MTTDETRKPQIERFRDAARALEGDKDRERATKPVKNMPVGEPE